MAFQVDLKSLIDKAVHLLESNGVFFEHGLSDEEIERTEKTFGFKFPPDLRPFLQTALPADIKSPWGIGAFPNWRSGDTVEIQRRIDWPFEGIAFDIENNGFYLPAEPLLAGNPVFSVYQTDIIHYGCDLWDYFVNEFAPQEERWARYKGVSPSEYNELHRPIRFWSQFTHLAGETLQ